MGSKRPSRQRAMPFHSLDNAIANLSRRPMKACVLIGGLQSYSQNIHRLINVGKTLKIGCVFSHIYSGLETLSY
ncbi:MAG: hypothetical protein ABF821_12095 [Gluconacetobacter sp.]